DEDRVFLETAQTASGEQELVITPLCNWTMPLLRYRTGDLGRPIRYEERTCPCGRHLDQLVGFLGRDRGFVVVRTNRFYRPSPIKLYLTERPLALWQLLQNVPGE